MDATPEDIRRRRHSRRPASQLSLTGFEDRHRDGARPPGFSRPAEASTGATQPRSRPRRRPRPDPAGGSAASILEPIEQMEVLLRSGHLLRPKEREWVGKIARTVRARGESADLSARQRTVICDIFDRLRDRVGR